MQRCILALALGLAGALPACSTGAATVYKWVGSDGVTHYSESLPGPRPRELERLELDGRRQEQALPPDYRSALEVARDIEASRLKREQMRLEREKLRLEQTRAQRDHAPGYTDSRSYLPVYPAYPYYFRHHPRPHRFRHGGKPIIDHDWPPDFGVRPGGAGVRARLPGLGGQ